MPGERRPAFAAELPAPRFRCRSSRRSCVHLRPVGVATPSRSSQGLAQPLEDLARLVERCPRRLSSSPCSSQRRRRARRACRARGSAGPQPRIRRRRPPRVVRGTASPERRGTAARDRTERLDEGEELFDLRQPPSANAASTASTMPCLDDWRGVPKRHGRPRCAASPSPSASPQFSFGPPQRSTTTEVAEVPGVSVDSSSRENSERMRRASSSSPRWTWISTADWSMLSNSPPASICSGVNSVIAACASSQRPSMTKG